MDAETLHDAALNILQAAEHFFPLRFAFRTAFASRSPGLARKVFGVEFPNPLGLAAGWDKNAKVPNALASLGFGFLELGTVTLWQELGNPRPRIWRDRGRRLIVNRVAFANDGCAAVSKRLEGKKCAVPVGISLGKMPASGAEELSGEVSAMLASLYPAADFFTVNISSPNTPRGFVMGRSEYLKQALSDIQAASLKAASDLGVPPKPLLVKVAPILDPRSIEELAAAVLETKTAGVIATNSAATPYGGLSGLPLKTLSLKTCARLYRHLQGSAEIIGVGGILTPEDAWERIVAGASLIQIFSGFVFSGPLLIGRILKHLSSNLRRGGLENISQAVGMEAHKFQ